mgnify:CR=1 FL=1
MTAATAAAATTSAAAAVVTTAAATATTTAAATTSASATAARGEHWIVNYESNLAAEILDVIYRGFFQERYAVRVHQKFNAFHVQNGVVSLGFFFHGQHILKPTVFGWHRNHSQGTAVFALFVQNFLKFFDRQCSNFHNV